MSARSGRLWVTLRSAAAATLVATLLATAVEAGARRQGPGAPARVVDYDPPVRIESYRFTDFGRSPGRRDDRTGKARFRVVERSGNCCENYLAISKKGRLFDLGGAYINFTDDDGKTWKQVGPINPLVNGEGTISLAPGGDVIGVEWDPYSGDHLLSYKYDAALDQWLYLEMPLHTPFYDRPWLTVVPGPFSINGSEVPYVVFVDGFPHRGPFLYSTDGLAYVQMSSPFVDEQLEPSAKGWLETTKERDFDWVLPNTNSPITALGGGYAVAQPGPFTAGWSLFNPETLRWSALQLPDGATLTERLLVDSHGRLHNVVPAGDRFLYRISSNGGRSWKEVEIAMPKDHSTGGMMDFRVNASVGIAAVGIRATAGEFDRDLLFKIDISSDKARLMRLYEVGLGDINSAAGVGQEIRFDFETVAIFPDGRLAISILDSSTGPVFHLQEPIAERIGPALAIEL